MIENAKASKKKEFKRHISRNAQRDKFNHETNTDKCLEIEENNRIRVTDEQAKKYINSICGCDSVTEFQKFTEIKKEISIRKMYKKGLSIRQIVRLTGTSKGLVEKWLK